MRILPASFSLLLSTLALAAQPPQAPDISPKEAAIERLLGERSSQEALEAAIQEAEKLNIPAQAILEARFIFHVDRNEDAKVAALLPQFLKQNSIFKIEESEIFATRDEWLAVIEYVKALDALEKGDKTAFKSHITEAFWLSPKQGNAFAPHIDRVRMADALAAMKLDFSETFLPIVDGHPTPLSTILGDKKALLLQFWSPLSPECETSLPDFSRIHDTIAPKGISIATLVLDNSPAALADTRSMIGSKPSGTWLIDHADNPLSPRLGIQILPSFVLVSKEGRILAFGPGDNSELWSQLSKIDPSISQPQTNHNHQEGPED